MEKYLISADYDDRRIFFMKKDSEISRMFQYAGNRHWLTVLGMILAGLSTVLSMDSVRLYLGLSSAIC